VYENHSARLLTRRQFARRLARHFASAAALVAVSLVAGMAGYIQLAHESWVDAFLNAAMLLGGMGPVGELPNDSSKIFAGIYALYAGLVFIASATLLIAPVAHRIMHRLHLDKK
jgi:hypothetical protein